jgi:hypothetical protein
LIPSKERIGEWETDYRKMDEMFFTPAPDFSSIIASCRAFQQRLKRA